MRAQTQKRGEQCRAGFRYRGRSGKQPEEPERTGRKEELPVKRTGGRKGFRLPACPLPGLRKKTKKATVEEFEKASGRTESSPGKIPCQIPAGPFHPLKDMAGLFRGRPERIGNFQGAVRIPGPEPDGFDNGFVSEIGQQSPIFPVHQDDQVRPFHEKRRNELRTMIRKVDADLPGLPGVVLGGGLPFPRQKTAGRDFKPRRVEKSPEQSFHHGAAANISITDYQNPKLIRELEDLLPGEGAFLRACESFPGAKKKIFRMISDHAVQPSPRIISAYRPSFGSKNCLTFSIGGFRPPGCLRLDPTLTEKYRK